MHKLIKCPCCNTKNITDSGKIIVDYQGNKYLICKCCNSWFQFDVFKKEYGLNYFSDAIDPDGNRRNILGEKEFKLKNWFCETIKYVNSKQPGLIMDIGAGLGFFLSAVNSQWIKYANESSPELVNFLQNNYSDINVISIIDSDFIENHKNSFDIIILYHVIEHLHDPSQMLDMIHKLLKNNGELIVGTPNIGSFCAKIFKGNFRLLGDGHLCLYNKKSLISLCRNSGFDFIRVKYPFFQTQYFSIKNLIRLFKPKMISPPFYGSVMNLYFKAKK